MKKPRHDNFAGLSRKIAMPSTEDKKRTPECAIRVACYREYVKRMRECYAGYLGKYLPNVMVSLINDFVMPTELEHFVLVLRTGMISGSVKLTDNTISVKIIAFENGFAAKGYGSQLGDPWQFPKLQKYLMNVYDFCLLGSMIIGANYALIGPCRGHELTGDARKHQGSEIGRMMYGKYKRAARKLMYRHLRGFRAN